MNAWIRDVVWNWKNHWFEWFHVVYASIVIVSAFSNIWPSEAETRELLLLVAFLIYFVVLLVFLILFTFKFSRKSRYAEATKCLHSALHSARDAYHYLDWCKSEDHEKIVFDEERLCAYMKTTLTSIADAFTIVSGVRCRSSIKVLGQNSQGQLFVKTLARDEVSQVECQKKDSVETTSHLVSLNTDFSEITEGNLDYFYVGDLTKYLNYTNTSMKKHDSMKSEKWTLPYKSTIVWPIRYVYIKSEVENGTGTHEDLYGFLTLDSSSVNSFIKRYDVQMGALLADSLFPVLNAYISLNAK